MVNLEAPKMVGFLAFLKTAGPVYLVTIAGKELDTILTVVDFAVVGKFYDLDRKSVV